MQDIDMAGVSYSYSSLSGGIGSSFSGSFQGNGHSILGLKAGLFKRINRDGAIYRTNFYGCTVDGAAVIAEDNYGKISHCAVLNCTVYNTSFTSSGGMVAGYTSSSGSIYNCMVQNCSITSTLDCAGGICGRNDGTIEKCYSECSVYSSNAAGGISGRNYGTVTACLSNPVVLSGDSYEGGISGTNSGGHAAITGCLSQYLPLVPESIFTSKKPCGSIVGDIYDGEEYIAGNSGAVNYLPPMPDTSGMTEQQIEIALKEYQEKLESWMRHHGDLNGFTGLTNPGIPITEISFDAWLLDAVSEGLADAIGFIGVHFAFAKNMDFETELFNKAFPFTDIELIPASGQTDNQDTDAKDTDNKDADNKDADNQDTDSKNTDNKDADNQDTDSKDTDNKDADSKDTDSKDTDNKDADSKDTDAKDAGNKDADSKNTDSKNTDSRDTDSKDTGTKDTDTKQTTTKKVKIGDCFTVGKCVVSVTSVSKKEVKYLLPNANISVKTISIPNYVKIKGKTYTVTSISATAFSDYKNLTEVKFGGKIKALPAGILKNAKKLKKVTIGSGVKSIGKNAFYGCKNLKTVIINSKKLTKKNVGAGAFKGINSKAVISVPSGSLKTYKTILKAKGITGKYQKIKKLK